MEEGGGSSGSDENAVFFRGARGYWEVRARGDDISNAGDDFQIEGVCVLKI